MAQTLTLSNQSAVQIAGNFAGSHVAAGEIYRVVTENSFGTHYESSVYGTYAVEMANDARATADSSNNRG